MKNPFKRKEDDEGVIVVLVADTHPNDKEGLCADSVTDDQGGTYMPNGGQVWLKENWRDFWTNWVWKAKREFGFPVVTFHNGDGADKNKHDGVGLISRNDTTIVRLAGDARAEQFEISDYSFEIRGTEAHAGKQANLEEKLAEDMQEGGIVPNEKLGRWSWYVVEAVLGGVKFDVTHHPITSSRRAHTRAQAAARQAFETMSKYLLEGTQPPDIVVRSHVHYWADSGTTYHTRCFFTPPWKRTDAFGHRLGAGVHIEPVGGIVLICKDGKYTLWPDGKPVRYKTKREEPWTLSQA